LKKRRDRQRKQQGKHPRKAQNVCSIEVRQIALRGIGDDDPSMNISSSVNLSQLGATDTQGANVRQDYGVAVAMKAKDLVKLEGESAVKLIESAPAPSTDAVRGKNISTYA
jgi:hypothetical protein